MKRFFLIFLSAVLLLFAVAFPVSAVMTSEEQAAYDGVPIVFPDCGAAFTVCDDDGNSAPMTWAHLKDSVDYDTAAYYYMYCDNCCTEVTFHFWACAYSGCRICLPVNPGDICPECHAYQVIPDDVDEMINGANDALNSYYAGTVYGYELGKTAGEGLAYDRGYADGYSAGKADGDSDGTGGGSSGETGDITGTDAYQAGLAAGRQQVIDELEATSTTNKYYLAGVSAGYDNGYSEGYAAGEKSGYTKGFSAGYSAGYAANQEALKKAQEEAERAKAQYDSAYQKGVEAEVSKNFVALVGEIAAAPFHAVQNMFDFDIFGFNVASILLSIFTTIVTVSVVVLVLKHVL